MTRLKRLQQRLPEGCCALVTSDINRRYFTKMRSSAGTLAVFPESAYLIIDFRYIEKARATVTDCEVIEQGELYRQLSELISANRADTVAIESEALTVAQLERLRSGIGGSVSFDCSGFLSGEINALRMIKSEEEIALITHAQRIAEAAFNEALGFISEGVTERETALFLNEYMLRHGAEELSFDTIVLFGENTSMPHGVPSEKRLKRGEFILADFGAVTDGYHSDMTRTAVFGEPSEEMERVYSIVLKAQERAISTAAAGITGRQLDAAAREFIAENGFKEAFGHGLGHSVGLEIHESPCANTRDETVLRENMIMTIEPGIYLPGKFGVRIEDFVVIKQNSCVNLTNAPKNLIKL